MKILDLTFFLSANVYCFTMLCEVYEFLLLAAFQVNFFFLLNKYYLTLSYFAVYRGFQ